MSSCQQTVNTTRGRRIALLLFALLLLTATPLLADPFAEPTLRAGFYWKSFPNLSREDIDVSLRLLTEEIGDTVGIESHVTVYDEVETMRRDFEVGKINFVVASSIVLATKFDNRLFVDGFRFLRNGAENDRILVLANNKSGKTAFKDFSGVRLVLAQYDPVREMVMDVLTQKTFKKGYKANFKEMPREKNDHQLILKLFFDQADITCVYDTAYQTSIELNPQLLTKLQVITQVEGLPQGSGLFHRNTPAEFREHVIEETLKLNTRSRGQLLLQLFQTDQAVRSTPADLVPALKLIETYQSLVSEK